MHVLVAGATGAIGRRLVPLLIARGHRVTGMVRNGARADALRQWGMEVAVADGLDGAAVGEAVARAEPDVIVHQMTSLAGKPDMKHFDRWFAGTNALRTEGTEHLLAAAGAAGVGRFVAQSFTGWPNERRGGAVKTEEDPLDPDPARAQVESLAAIRFLEEAVTGAPLDGIVLRYGSLYGPGASDPLVDLVRRRMLPMIGDGAGVWSWIHVDDAASATVAALERGAPGIYNIVDNDPAPVAAWLPAMAAAVGGRPPLRVPVWLGRLMAGQTAVQAMTEARGSSNARARRMLGWEPAWSSWRDGFRHALTEEARPLEGLKGATR